VRLDLTLAGSSSKASRLTTMEAHALLGAAGFGPVDVPRRPSGWYPQAGRPSLVAVLAEAAEAAGTKDTLAGLADAGPSAPGLLFARTACRSTRWRSCSRSRCAQATAGPTSMCGHGGPAAGDASGDTVGVGAAGEP
jgi:hypothetical protein